MSDNNRNPTFVPKAASTKKACPFCGAVDWTGRHIQGAITFTCRPCGGKWQGGLGQLPQDPTIPVAPERTEPTVRFVENKALAGGVEEIRRRPDMRSDFRKGALITPDEE